ncbi:hypothetical protein Mpsy_1241 [Methanolobus psychrophilus R15]|nr:hypothetical protein Mpsy_1241 [Methanolobus psychrophilus R15]
MLPELLQHIGFLKYIIKIYHQHELKCAFTDEIEIDLRKLEEAYSDMITDFYLIFDAMMMGTLIPPEKPGYTISKIVQNYTKSLENVEKSG